MDENVKAGTRCECREIGNKCHNGGGYGEAECQADAVRLVTVHVPEADSLTFGYAPARTDEVPMCAACAEYHERGSK